MNNDGRLVVNDEQGGGRPVDMEMQALLGKPPQTIKDIRTHQREIPANELGEIDLAEACERVLRFPTVADKSFLIHIGDRTVGGLVAQDQLAGPWQVPVNDVGVTLRGFESEAGEAMAMGERTPVAVLDPAASGRLAVAEAITNIAAARIEKLGDVRLSANWMAASGIEAEDQALFETVRAVGHDLCRELGIAIPVGKDSLSMQTRWQEDGADKSVRAPLSLIISAFAPVVNVRRSLTPQLRPTIDAPLYLLDLGGGRNRLGASCLSQVMGLPGGEPPDLDSPAQLKALFDCIQRANSERLLLAYHDRSDGGLFACIAEMCFAGHIGVDITLDERDCAAQLAELFAEEPGVVVQVAAAQVERFEALVAECGIGSITLRIGRPNADDTLRLLAEGSVVYEAGRVDLQRIWSEVSYRMQAERDNPRTALQQYDAILDAADPGLAPELSFDPDDDIAAPFIAKGVQPRIAILREQGVNSHFEMAAAFHRAGFQPVDVHMSDLISGRTDLAAFSGAVACGGFSFGDVLGAGGGWAKSILFNEQLRDQFQAFFERDATFALGVCNGCQMLADLQELIPGADHWPRFVRNRSEQFEARLSLVEVMDSKSVFMRDMQGSRLPIVVSHGEGRAEFAGDRDLDNCFAEQQVAIRFVDNYGQLASHYPANPNGSPGGIAGLCSADGRVTILMPHPERVHLSAQHSWCPDDWGTAGPWLRMFRNARVWLG
jgi:phosphoribosylformylglycinamidine synthase